MRKCFLRCMFLFSFVLLPFVFTASSDGAELKTRRAVMEEVEEVVEDYFDNKKLKATYESEISKNQGDGSYTLSYKGKTMRFLMERKGKPDKNGKYPLYITLHGGGGTSQETNDKQWMGMFSHYKDSVKNGIYIACRGITNTWDLHFQSDSYILYDRLIQNMIYNHKVDPNRVYLIGFSAGGDGVYQILPRMADRFAAGNMSSGHPNGVSLLNLANCPISIQVGIRDYYSRSAMRSVRGAEFDSVLNGHRRLYGFGYTHRVYVHAPAGHNYVDNNVSSQSDVLEDPEKFAKVGEKIINDFVSVLERHEDFSGSNDQKKISRVSYHPFRNDGFNQDIMDIVTNKYRLGTKRVSPDAVTYLSKFKRNPLPSKIIWDLGTRADSRETKSFYWLQADRWVNKGIIEASIDSKTNTVRIKPDKNVKGDFSILISPYMLDVTKPVQVITPKGKVSVNIDLSEDTIEDMIEESLEDRGDPNYVYVGTISYKKVLSLTKTR